MIIALNKVDNLKPSHIVTGMKAGAALGDFHALHPVSAVTKDGVDELRADLLHLLPEGQPFFERESATDQTDTERIVELIREKALQLTRDEVPHAVSVELDELEDRHLRAFVLVETESQKQILVGKKGAVIREIGVRARPEIERLLGKKIFLELVVKVRPRWRREDAQLDRLGLVATRRSSRRALVGELERLDHDLVAAPVQPAGGKARRPCVLEQPPVNRLAGLVEEHDRHVPPLEGSVPRRLEPVPEVGATGQPPLEDDVRVADAAGQLARAAAGIAALPILDRLDCRVGKVDLAEGSDFDPVDLHDEVEVRVGVVTLDRHGWEPPSRWWRDRGRSRGRG